MTAALGCQSTLAGYCLGMPPVNVFMAAVLFAAAVILLDRFRMEARDE